MRPPGLNSLLAGHLRRRALAYLVSAALLALGLSTGILASGALDAGARGELRQSLAGLLTADAARLPPGQIVQHALLSGVLGSGLAMWALGLSIIGLPVVAALLFLHGFAYGFSLSFLIAAFDGRELAGALAAILPQMLLGVPAILLCATGALSFAATAGRRLLGADDPPHVLGAFAQTGAMIACGCALFLFAGLVEAYVGPTLGHWLRAF